MDTKGKPNVRRFAFTSGLTALLLSAGLAIGGLATAASSDPAGASIPGLTRRVVAMAATTSGNGYWLAGRTGSVTTFGDAKVFGDATKAQLNQPIVGMAATATGNGYWLVTGDGVVFGFGDAKDYGSTAKLNANKRIVGMAATKTGKGYWLVTNEGGIYTFGDAKFFGSGTPRPLSAPIVGMAVTKTGNGYWLVSSDGEIVTFGDAKAFAAVGVTPPYHRVVDLTVTATGNGYWMIGNDGTVYRYGDATAVGTTRSCTDGTSTIGTPDAVVRPCPTIPTTPPTTVAPTTTTPPTTTAPTTTTPPSTAAQTPPVTVTPVVTTPPTTAPPAVSNSTKEARVAQEMYQRLNAERAARGLPALGWDGALAARAKDWSVTMQQSGFRHSDLHPLLGRFYIAAENIGTGSARSTSGAVHTAWMRSTTHRVNLLAPNLDVVGIGVYCAADGTMWATQNFGRFPSSSLPWDFGPTPAATPVAAGDPGGTTCS